MSKTPIAAALIVVVGGAVFAWVRSRPQVHPLAITITEQGIPATALRSARMEYVAPGFLRATDDIASAANGQEVERGSSDWEVLDVKMRTSPQGEWQSVKPPPRTNAATWPIKLPLWGDLPYAMINGLADRAGQWRFALRVTRLYRTSRGDTWRGSAEHVVTCQLVEDAQKPVFHTFMPGKAYVAGIQIQWTQDNSWQEIPQAGQPGFPLMLSCRRIVDLRAIRKIPNEPWPDPNGKGEEWPRWEGDGVEPGSFGSDSLSLDLDEPNLVARNPHDFKTVSVTCGNTVKRQILILPKPDIFVRESNPVFSKAPEQKANTLKLNVEADVKWSGGWHPPIKIRFSAREITPANVAKPIGQINGPAPQDDTMSLPGDGGIAKATLTVPANAGTVEVKALLILPNNTSEFHTTRISVPKLKNQTQ